MNMNGKCNIFISYRRQGGRELARTLRLALENLGYDNIFFDYNSLRDGMFNDRIITAINECNDFILVMTPGSMDRCVNEDDWVRREITEALEVGCNIIPILIDDKEVSYPEEFPRRLNIIKNIQASKLLTNEFFEESVKRIAERLHSHRTTKGKKSDLSDFKNSRVFSLLSQHPWLSFSFCLTTIFFVMLTCINREEETLDKAMETKDEKEMEENKKDGKEEALLNLLMQNYIPTLADSCFIPSLRDGLYGFVDQTGMILIEHRWANALPFTNGLAVVQNSDELYGYINKRGETVFPCCLKQANPFYEGLARVQNIEGLYGYIDNTGTEVIPYQWWLAGDFSQGLAIIQDENDKFGFIDKTGKIAIQCQWENANNFSEDLSAVEDSLWKYGYIDRTGKLVIPCKWTAAENFVNGIARVRTNDGKWIFIDKTGKVVEDVK